MTECKHTDWVAIHMNRWCRRCGAIMRYQPGLNSVWEMPSPMSTGQQELQNHEAFVEMQEEDADHYAEAKDPLRGDSEYERESALVAIGEAKAYLESMADAIMDTLVAAEEALKAAQAREGSNV